MKTTTTNAPGNPGAHENDGDARPPAMSIDDVRRLAATEFSLSARLGYVALLLVALAMTGVVVSLLLTEPVLPLRARIAFAVMAGIGLSWTAFALWVLTRRRVLLSGHEVIAGRMAVAFSGLFFAFALGVAWWRGGASAYGIATVGTIMLLGAIAVLARARRRFARLSERRRVLEQQIAKSA